jgi:putative RNA 2'-phosphotransferase
MALTVRERHGNPIILYIDIRKMYEDGYKFYLSENNVWMAEEVPIKYIKSSKFDNQIK